MSWLKASERNFSCNCVTLVDGLEEWVLRMQGKTGRMPVIFGWRPSSLIYTLDLDLCMSLCRATVRSPALPSSSTVRPYPASKNVIFCSTHGGRYHGVLHRICWEGILGARRAHDSDMDVVERS